MSNSELLQQISYEKSYRENRLKAAQWVLKHPEAFEELLTYCFTAKKDLSYKAAWALEFVYLEKPELLLPHLELFFKNLSAVTSDQILRPLAHLCELLAISYYKKKEKKIVSYLSEAHKKIMVECSFDWLITDQKVACQVRAMTTLYYLGTEFEWIHPELKQIIETNLHKSSAGYRSRGTKILGKIQNS